MEQNNWDQETTYLVYQTTGLVKNVERLDTHGDEFC